MLITLGRGDKYRLVHIREALESGKELYISDKDFLHDLVKTHLKDRIYHARIVSTPDKPNRFCENCGSESSPDEKFCIDCGTAVEPSSPSSLDMPESVPEPEAIPKVESIADLATAMAGAGITATNGVLSTDAAGTPAAIVHGQHLAEGWNYLTGTIIGAMTVGLPNLTAPTPGISINLSMSAGTFP